MGDSIIFGINMNEDARTSPLALKIKALKLKDKLISLHPFLSSPDTFNQYKQIEVIEALFVRKNVEVPQAG